MTGYAVTFDSDPHTATGECLDLNGDPLVGLDLSLTTHTNAGTYLADAWTFTDVTGNYNDASGTVDSSIAKADATIIGHRLQRALRWHHARRHGHRPGRQRRGPERRPRPDRQRAQRGRQLHRRLDVHLARPELQRRLGHGRRLDRQDQPGLHRDRLRRHLRQQSAHRHGTAAGLQGERSSGFVLSGTTHTNAGTYLADAWTFTDGTGNYNNASGTVDSSIAKADATIVVTGYSVPFDGTTHVATGTALGVNSEDLSIGLDLTGTAHTNAGNDTDAWTFTSPTRNYNDASGHGRRLDRQGQRHHRSPATASPSTACRTPPRARGRRPERRPARRA